MTHTYEWDARNRLVKATTSGVGGNSDSESLYDKDGLRYKHVVTVTPASAGVTVTTAEAGVQGNTPSQSVVTTTSRYFYEDGGRLIAEQQGDTLYTYVHLGAHAVARFNESANSVSPGSDSVIPAQAGIQSQTQGENTWIPASAGMTLPTPATTSYLLYHRDALGTTLATSFYDDDLQQWKINPVDTLPYGQEASFHHAGTGQSTFEFTGKKLDSETNMFYFHDRPLLVGVPHFPQPDRGPWVYSNPKTLNRYQYGYGSPPNTFDPDGKLAIYVHGTNASSSYFRSKPEFVAKMNNITGDTNNKFLSWSGKNMAYSREVASEKLVKMINGHTFAEGEKLHIYAHSHGGNVALQASNYNLKKGIDNLVVFGTPIRDDYQPDFDNIGNLLNVQNADDWVQLFGGNDFPLSELQIEFGGDFLDGAKNIIYDKGGHGDYFEDFQWTEHLEY